MYLLPYHPAKSHLHEGLDPVFIAVGRENLHRNFRCFAEPGIGSWFWLPALLPSFLLSFLRTSLPCFLPSLPLFLPFIIYPSLCIFEEHPVNTKYHKIYEEVADIAVMRTSCNLRRKQREL